MKFFRSPYAPLIVLVVVSVAFGIVNYKDYGLAWDEDAQREIGIVNYEYVVHGNRARLDNYFNKDYGPAFEVLLIAIERKLNITKFRDIYLMRHFATHILFLIGCMAAYGLVFRTYKNSLLASLGFLIVYLFPRFYAHSYFNSKDIIFLSLFFITLFAVYRAFETKRTVWYIIAGILCGYTTGIRILGIIIPAAMGLVLVLNAIVCIMANKSAMRPMLFRITAFALSCIAAIILFWPLLWTSPVNNFIESYQRMAHFRWQGWVLLKGGFIEGTNLPVMYFPTWFCLTTPIVWLLLGIIGIVWFVVDFLRRPLVYLEDLTHGSYIVYLLVFLLPICMVIILHAVIYDEWRHLYFIFAGFFMFIIFAVQRLLATRMRIVVIGLCGLQLGLLAFFMIKNHPFQQVYFNELMTREPEFIRHNYELDYWGVSTKQGYEYILEHDSSASIRVGSPKHHYPAIINYEFLTDDQRKRIVKVEEQDSCDYFITFFRFHPKDYEGHLPIHDIKVHNNTVLRISKIAGK